MSDLSDLLRAYVGTFGVQYVEPCPETGGVCVNTGGGMRVPIVLGPRNANGFF